MASFNDCVDIAFKAGRISKDVAETIKAADNPDAAIDGILGDLSRQKREAAIQAVRIAEGFENIKSHPVSMYDGLVSLLTKDPTGQAPYKNVEYTAKNFSAKYQAGLADMLSAFRTRTLGITQDQKGLNDLVKAIYGEAVDDPRAVKFADDWKNVTEEMRTDFNRMGGSISKNERWLLPQNHDLIAVKEVGLKDWKEKIRPMLDRDNMLDDAGHRLTDADFDQSLDFVYETITTGGLNKVSDFTVPRLGKKLSRKGSDKRFLFFKDADSWLAYQKDFGKGDVFTTLTDHIESRSNDTANMSILGTSPEATFQALMAQVVKESEVTGRQKFMAEAIFRVATGKVNQGELTTVADFMQSTKNLLSAAILGKAFISSISDVGASAITSNYNNIPVFKVLSRQMALMNPANEADRIAAVKMGLLAEAWLGRAHAANRYVDTYGNGVTAKIAEGVMRGSLLSPWTDAGRKAFGMEFASMLADNFGKPISELDDAVKRAFESYGINEADWNQFRASKTLDFKGAKFADMLQPGGAKFHQMVLSETDFAVPTPDARVRAITTGGLGRGTIEGQGWRAVMMLKSFPVTIASTHFYRAAYQASTGQKLAYLGTLVASMTALGGVALQAKDLVAGREPRPVDEKFFAAAFQQGGGLGIFGDFIFSDVNRFGGGITETIIGPMGGLLDDTVKLTLGNIREAVAGEETNVLGEAANFTKRYTPDIWQTHLFKNAVFDQIKLMADPDSNRKFRRVIKNRQKDYNQGYWWKPGQPKPELAK